jgi:hypothetical protein
MCRTMSRYLDSAAGRWIVLQDDRAARDRIGLQPPGYAMMDH